MEIRKEEVEQAVFYLYDDYAHNRIDRRMMTAGRCKVSVIGMICWKILLPHIST